MASSIIRNRYDAFRILVQCLKSKFDVKKVRPRRGPVRLVRCGLEVFNPTLPSDRKFLWNATVKKSTEGEATVVNKCMTSIKWYFFDVFKWYICDFQDFGYFFWKRRRLEANCIYPLKSIDKLSNINTKKRPLHEGARRGRAHMHNNATSRWWKGNAITVQPRHPMNVHKYTANSLNKRV